MKDKTHIYGDRSQQSIAADLHALREWVRQRQADAAADDIEFRLIEDMGRMSFVLTMQEGVNASLGALPIARFKLVEGPLAPAMGQAQRWMEAV